MRSNLLSTVPGSLGVQRTSTAITFSPSSVKASDARFSKHFVKSETLRIDLAYALLCPRKATTIVTTVWVDITGFLSAFILFFIIPFNVTAYSGSFSNFARSVITSL